MAKLHIQFVLVYLRIFYTHKLKNMHRVNTQTRCHKDFFDDTRHSRKLAIANTGSKQQLLGIEPRAPELPVF